ncbi:MAG: zinc-binding alcohol dehydrogenase family protein [Chitinophagaceae bacterium]|nr:zinc-binding alcohol dehydrogenase family protein [Chitinophagaceae bacterium]
MRSLQCVQPGSFEYTLTPDPTPREGYSIIKIQRIGVCGTDLHAFEGTQPYFEYPRVLGHELAATFVSGDAPGFDPGEAVTVIPYLYCGKCIACRNGKTNCCVSIRVCGVHCDGGMTEYYSVPSYALLHGEGLSFEELALVEPLSIGAHAIRRARVKEGEFVLVIGAGPIGLGIMEFARITGARVIAMDINPARLSFCKTHLHVEHAINGREEHVMEKLHDITCTDMPTVVIDATGSQRAINNAFQYMAHGARYVLVGLQKEMISFSHPEFHKREATLMSSRNAAREDFAHVMDAMKKGFVKPATYITHRLSFAEAKTGFPALLKPETGVIKAMIEMD